MACAAGQRHRAAALRGTLAHLACVAALAAATPSALALGLTETVPAGLLMIDEQLILSRLSQRWNDDGELAPLIDPIERYEPGGGLQGVLQPRADVSYRVLLSQLQLGLLDDLTLAVALPVVLSTDVTLDLGWTPGDYQSSLGRPYGEADFWEWAASMGQPRPKSWRGNEGTLADTVCGVRWRFSDRVPWLREHGAALALQLMASLPTGHPPDPERVAVAGTTSWDLHSQGELAAHLLADLPLPDGLSSRLALSVDLFYEALLEHEYDSPEGTLNPLLMRHAPYIGPTYRLDPGDFSGASVQVDAVPWPGPVLSTWLVGGDAAAAARLPPVLTVGLRYTHTHLGQSDWSSDSPLWDWQQEQLWRPGYKNTLTARAVLSGLRWGVPLQLHVGWRNQTWLPGRNSRAANVLSVGVQVPVPVW